MVAWPNCGVIMLPVSVQDPAPGSYSSAEPSAAPESPLRPPATSTLPSGSSVAVWSLREVIMLPVVVHEAAVGGTTAGVSVGAGDGATVGLGLGSAVGFVTATGSVGAGTGGTSDGSFTKPEPAAAAPPTSSRAAAASSHVRRGARPAPSPPLDERGWTAPALTRPGTRVAIDAGVDATVAARSGMRNRTPRGSPGRGPEPHRRRR